MAVAVRRAGQRTEQQRCELWAVCVSSPAASPQCINDYESSVAVTSDSDSWFASTGCRCRCEEMNSLAGEPSRESFRCAAVEKGNPCFKWAASTQNYMTNDGSTHRYLQVSSGVTISIYCRLEPTLSGLLQIKNHAVQVRIGHVALGARFNRNRHKHAPRSQDAVPCEYGYGRECHSKRLAGFELQNFCSARNRRLGCGYVELQLMRECFR